MDENKRLEIECQQLDSTADSLEKLKRAHEQQIKALRDTLLPFALGIGTDEDRARARELTGANLYQPWRLREEYPWLKERGWKDPSEE